MEVSSIQFISFFNQMSEVQILYSLVHREDLLDSSKDAHLQLYLPAAKQNGLLHYKSSLQFCSVNSSSLQFSSVHSSSFQFSSILNFKISVQFQFSLVDLRSVQFTQVQLKLVHFI